MIYKDVLKKYLLFADYFESVETNSMKIDLI